MHRERGGDKEGEGEGKERTITLVGERERPGERRAREDNKIENPRFEF